MGPLNGIRVVESAMLFNGPVTGYILADLGAEVIKVEPPGTGDISRGYETMFGASMNRPGLANVAFEVANRGKKSIVLNLKSDDGRSILYKLIEKSDVFITNLRKSSTQKHKIDYHTLRGHNPKIIYASTSTYGAMGPRGEQRGYDMQAQAISGAMWEIFGDRDSVEPSVAVGSIFDQIGATVLLYGILAALVARERTGIGQEVRASLVGSAIHLQATNINTFLWQRRGMSRFSRERCRNPLANYYQCADKKWVLLCETQIQRYWPAFLSAIEIQELENDPRYSTPDGMRQNFSEFIAILDRKFATKPRDEWLKIFSGHDFGYAPVHDYAEMVDDPQVWANDYIVEIDHPSMGKVKTVASPVGFSETPISIGRGAPEYGQHTEEVLTDILGYSWEEIGKLRDMGALM